MTLVYFNKIFSFNKTTHISALVRQQLDFRIVKWCQTAEAAGGSGWYGMVSDPPAG